MRQRGEGGGGAARGDRNEERERERERVGRDDSRRPGTPTPYTSASSTTCTTSTTLITSISRTGTRMLAHRNHSSTPIDPYSRSLKTRKRWKQPTRMVRALKSPIRLTALPPILASCAEYLANEYLPRQQQQQGTGTGATKEPTPETWRVYGYHLDFPSSPRIVCAVSLPALPSPAPYMRTGHALASPSPTMSLQTLTHPGCPRARTHDMVYRRLGMRTSPFQMQMPIPMGVCTSTFLRLLHLPLPPRLLQLGASNWHAP